MENFFIYLKMETVVQLVHTIVNAQYEEYLLDYVIIEETCHSFSRLIVRSQKLCNIFSHTHHFADPQV